MSYISPFDSVESMLSNSNLTWSEKPITERSEYEGTIEVVLDRIIPTINNSLPTWEDGVDFVNDVGRILRYAIEAKINNPSIAGISELVEASTQLGLQLFRYNPHVSQTKSNTRELLVNNINLFREMIYAHQFELDLNMNQSYDQTIWLSSHPSFSQRSAEGIHKATQKPILMIALGHGAYSLAIDTFLRYVELSKTGFLGDLPLKTASFLSLGDTPDNHTEPVIYPIRLSTRLLKEERLNISPAELEILQKLANGRDIVFMDGDTQYGGTLKSAVSQGGELFPESRIFSRVNYHMKYIIPYGLNLIDSPYIPMGTGIDQRILPPYMR